VEVRGALYLPCCRRGSPYPEGQRKLTCCVFASRLGAGACPTWFPHRVLKGETTARVPLLPGLSASPPFSEGGRKVPHLASAPFCPSALLFACVGRKSIQETNVGKRLQAELIDGFIFVVCVTVEFDPLIQDRGRDGDVQPVGSNQVEAANRSQEKMCGYLQLIQRPVSRVNANGFQAKQARDVICWRLCA